MTLVVPVSPFRKAGLTSVTDIGSSKLRGSARECARPLRTIGARREPGPRFRQSLLAPHVHRHVARPSRANDAHLRVSCAFAVFTRFAFCEHVMRIANRRLRQPSL